MENIIKQLTAELNLLKKENSGLRSFIQNKQEGNSLNDIKAAVIDNLSEGIVITHLSGQITYVNRAIENYSGYTHKELTGQFPGILNGEVEADSIQERIADSVGRSQRVCHELLQKCKDGNTYLAELEIFPVYNSEGTAIALASVQRDITKRKNIENALLKKNHELQMILDFLPAYACVKDVNGTYTMVNKRLCDALNLGKHEVIGKTDFELFPPEYAEKYRNDDLVVLKTGESFYIGEEKMMDNKKSISVSVRKAPLRDTNGNFIGLIRVC